MEKLHVKDLISVGIFSLLFIALIFIVACFQVLPILSVALPILMALFSGPVYLLFVARTGKPFCITILGLLVSLIVGLLVFGNIYICLFNFVIFILAELVASIGKYKSFKINLLSYIVLSVWVFGEIGAYWIAKDWMRAKSIASGVDLEFVEKTFELSTTTNLLIVLVLTIICAVISGLVSKSMFKKHFSRAGMI